MCIDVSNDNMSEIGGFESVDLLIEGICHVFENAGKGVHAGRAMQGQGFFSFATVVSVIFFPSI